MQLQFQVGRWQQKFKVPKIHDLHYLEIVCTSWPLRYFRSRDCTQGHQGRHVCYDPPVPRVEAVSHVRARHSLVAICSLHLVPLWLPTSCFLVVSENHRCHTAHPIFALSPFFRSPSHSNPSSQGDDRDHDLVGRYHRRRQSRSHPAS
jgi:hypothetical protein